MILALRTIPDPILTVKCSPVKRITPDIVSLIEDMTQTMRHYTSCVGIAAPQVGITARVIVIDVSRHAKPHDNSGLLVLINPVIVSSEGSRTGREGCLSVPEFTGNVSRAENITIEALDKAGKPYSFTSHGFEAVVLQHEIDHCDGILFLDRVSSLRTDVFRRKR